MAGKDTTKKKGEYSVSPFPPKDTTRYRVTPKRKAVPGKVEKIYCLCGELLLKIYPWASIGLSGRTPKCKKCQVKMQNEGSGALKVRRSAGPGLF